MYKSLCPRWYGMEDNIRHIVVAKDTTEQNVKQQAKQMAMQDQGQMDLVKQAGQFASSPVMDPQKNPQLGDQAQQVANAILGGQQPPMQQ